MERIDKEELRRIQVNMNLRYDMFENSKLTLGEYNEAIEKQKAVALMLHGVRKRTRKVKT